MDESMSKVNIYVQSQKPERKNVCKVMSCKLISVPTTVGVFFYIWLRKIYQNVHDNLEHFSFQFILWKS